MKTLRILLTTAVALTLAPMVASAEEFAQAPAKLKVGLMLPATGTFAALGAGIENGFKLYVNQQGGKLSGREIEYVKVDDESDPSKATDNVNKLIKRDNVDVIVGTVHSGVALAMARALARVECRRHNAEGIQADRAVCDVDGDVPGLAAGSDGDRMRRADRRLNQVVEGGRGGVGAALRKTDHRDVDDPRVDLTDRLVGESETLHGRRTNVAGEHVGLLKQAHERSVACIRFQVEHDTSLVPVGPEEDRTHSILAARADAAGSVAVGSFDLDHISPEISEHLGGRGAHQNSGQIDHAHAT
jgi:hypothetical protein